MPAHRSLPALSAAMLGLCVLLPARAEPPRLFLTPALEYSLRAKVAQPGHHGEAFAALRQRVARGREAYDGRPGYQASALAREAALAYRLTGDPAYADLAYSALAHARAEDQDQPDRGYGLSRAMMSLGYAIAWDWCRDAWSPGQRDAIFATMRAAADAWPNFRHGNVEAAHKGSNWVGVTRGGEFLLHLAARGFDDYGDRTDRLELCVADLRQHLRTAYGPSGWTQEGLGYLQYTFGFLAPAALAARDTEWPELWHEFAAIDWDRVATFALSFRPGQPMLQSGVGGERVYNEGFASLVFPTVPPERLGAYRFFYDRHMGILSPTPSYDGQRAGALWSVLLYRDEVAPAPPAGGPLIDARKGAYYFRNRWQDADDILLSLMMRNSHHSHGWAQQETFGLAIMAFDTTFAAGPGKERAPEAYSKLLIDGIDPPRGFPGARLLAAYPDAHGGGTLIVDGAANLGLERAERRFTVDFSGRTGVPARLLIADDLSAREPFVATFQIRPGPGLSVESGRDLAGPWFLLRRGDAWLKGWSLGPETHSVIAGTHAQVRTPRSTRHRLQLVLALGRGEPPAAPPGL
jgi:hypothetical protein